MSDQTSFYPELAKDIAPARGRLGVLLPGIPEILDAQQQLEVCCQKAGISSPQSVELFRFTVDRYAEPGAEH